MDSAQAQEQEMKLMSEVIEGLPLVVTNELRRQVVGFATALRTEADVREREHLTKEFDRATRSLATHDPKAAIDVLMPLLLETLELREANETSAANDEATWDQYPSKSLDEVADDFEEYLASPEGKAEQAARDAADAIPQKKESIADVPMDEETQKLWKAVFGKRPSEYRAGVRP